MFDAICIRRQTLGLSQEPVDIILLAEAMLFYQRTYLFADIDMIRQLAREFGPALLVELVREGYLQISYVRKWPAIAFTNGEPSAIVYEPATADSTNGEWRLELTFRTPILHFLEYWNRVQTLAVSRFVASEGEEPVATNAWSREWTS